MGKESADLMSEFDSIAGVSGLQRHALKTELDQDDLEIIDEILK